MWNPKWASDARHMVVGGPFVSLGPHYADTRLGQFADDFNSIAKWVQVQFDEVVRIDQAAFSFQSGVAIASAALDGIGQSLNPPPDPNSRPGTFRFQLTSSAGNIRRLRSVWPPC